ncbi:hypothetical protein K0B96_00305 [Horticoccus luteus]|uniref:Uncharacterized protein n=1 Tax=Horticoccus luteus TaxID=2862869 RepID=A0A8F9XH97_9BACT|nr:hypothetical protein [Horticoccus luteus]QYM79090.1 hypothetical protein K0B96_00305 [Horticoccus luteus]
MPVVAFRLPCRVGFGLALLAPIMGFAQAVYQSSPLDFALRGAVSIDGTSMGAFTENSTDSSDGTRPVYLAYQTFTENFAVINSFTLPADYTPSALASVTTYTSADGTTGGLQPYPIFTLGMPGLSESGALTLTPFTSAGLPVSMTLTPVTGGLKYTGTIGTSDGPSLNISGAFSFGAGTNGQDANSFSFAYRSGTTVITGKGSYLATAAATPQTIDFPAISDGFDFVSGGSNTIELAATASSGLPVVYHVVSGPATVSGNTLTVTGGGAIVIAADQFGHLNDGSSPEYAWAPEVTRSFTAIPEPAAAGIVAGLAALVLTLVAVRRRRRSHSITS